MDRQTSYARVSSAKCIVLLLILIFAPPTLTAYERHLDSESIREAFFLGQRRDEATDHFLASYRHYFPLPKTGPYISLVQILTPYAQVVLGSKEGTAGLTPMDAESEFGAQRTPFLVRVRVFSTPTYYSPSQLNELWEKLSISVSQGRTLRPLKTDYISRTGALGRGPGGTDVELSFDVKNVASAPITIDISSPDGQHLEAKFDLSKLK